MSTILTPENSLPGVAPGAMLWDVAGKVFVVFQVPGEDRYYGWHVTDLTQLEALGGSAAITRALSPEEAATIDFTNFGVRRELTNFDRDPREAFEVEMERWARVLPMLGDEEIADRAWGAFLEGRSLDVADIADTEYWKSRTPRQREWDTFVLQQGGVDSEAVKEQLGNSRLTVRDALIDAGWQGEPPESLVSYIADRYTTGQWDRTRLEDEILRHTDPTHPGASPFAGHSLPTGTRFVRDPSGALFADIDGGFYQLTGEGQAAQFGATSANTTTSATPITPSGTLADHLSTQQPFGDANSALGGEEQVRELLTFWLGPRIAGLYDQQWVREWAGRIRRNPDEVDVLTNVLRDARQEHFPNWAPNLSYADRVPYYRQLYQRAAGMLPDEANDDFFLSLMQVPEQGDASHTSIVQRLREEGHRQGWEPTTIDSYGGLAEITGAGQRRAI